MDERTRQLVAENRELVERWLKKKNEEAESMNAHLCGQQYHVAVLMTFIVYSMRISPLASVLPTGLGKRIRAHSEAIAAVAASDNGRWVATGSHDHTVKLWDAKTGELMVPWLSPTKDQQLTSVARRGLCPVIGRLYARCHKSLTGHVGKVFSAVFNSHTSQVVSGGHDRAIKIWDLSRGYCTRTIFSVSSCNSVTLGDGDGSTIVSGHMDSVVRLWDARSAKCFKELPSLHTGQITSVAVSSG
ncbi:WD40-repeat-containing domain protein [Thamnocephalis sphaerospora]|uniref:WD40-repeat-containing domain protein n=1 Tax=Thamnocephalis sphaerospora TaxID=78915 RepID=A0A4P9XP65_9FUNG|nr:WD40-repeat-containing domain protein [Thamnocephalis sphaerospora]|eukprot:RKP07775.1 WD40-repeat-containing domain protein [Thamnocephalis sphaerospora]